VTRRTIHGVTPAAPQPPGQRTSTWLEWRWGLYDFGNSAYALLIGGVGFQLYFKEVAFRHRAAEADFWWGSVVAASILLSAALSPLVGVAADGRGARSRYLSRLTALAVLGTGALAGVTGGAALGAVLAFLFANTLYNVALALYDSLLPFVARPSRQGVVSGRAWALGFAGGIACLALTHPFFTGQPAQSEGAYRTGFVLVAAFYGCFAVPLLLFPPREDKAGGAAGGARRPVRQLAASLKHWREHRAAFRFIVAYYFISEAILTSIYFTANYLSTTFSMTASTILALTALLQVVAIPATWLSGRLADTRGPRQILAGSVAVWMVVVLLLAAATAPWQLYAAAVLMGTVIGSTQAVGRVCLARLAPPARSGEFFGLNSMSSKVAATLGPFLFGVVSTMTGSQRLAWLSLLPFLVTGLILLVTDRS
jgi:UMF1 family MFS transporter